MRIGIGELADLGACSQADPNAGTYDSVNCPTSCFVLGNVLDTTILGQECWPCHNVCPPGTCWDTSALQCSGTPSATNPVIPSTQNDAPPPPPVDCTSTWSQLFNNQCGGSSSLLTYGAVAILGILGIIVVSKAL